MAVSVDGSAHMSGKVAVRPARVEGESASAVAHCVIVSRSARDLAGLDAAVLRLPGSA